MPAFYCEGCNEVVDGDWVGYRCCMECGEEYCEECFGADGEICGACERKWEATVRHAEGLLDAAKYEGMTE